MVNLRDHGQGIQILEVGPVRVVMDVAIGTIAEPLDLAPGPPLGHLGDGIVELPAGDKINWGPAARESWARMLTCGPTIPT